MRKIYKILIILFILMAYIPFSCFATENNATDTTEELIENNYTFVNSTNSLDAENALLGNGKVVDNVRAAVVYDANSQTLMHAWNADMQMYPASFVKIMTALIAVQRGNLSDLVTVNDHTISTVPHDAVSADLVADEVIKLEDLLYCLIVGSANDAATVIAEHVGGTQEAFVNEMNQYAKELGCSATHFTNPHGLHDENQHTTARDSAKILNAAVNNDIFKLIFTTKEYTVPATNKSESRYLQSGNSMLDSASKLYYDARVTGGRTGVTQDGRRCLASTAESNGMSLICIVMGAESVYQEDGYSAISIGGYKETSALLDTCFSGYKTVQVLHPNQAIRQIPVENGNNDVIIGPNVAVSAVLPHESANSDLLFQYSDVHANAPIKKGDKISDLQIWLNGTCVAQTALYALNTVSSNAPTTTMDENTQSDLSWIIWPIAILGAAAVLVFLYRMFNKVKLFTALNRSKRYRRGRRRSR